MAKSFLTSFDNMSLSDLDGESELIPLLTSEDEELLEKEKAYIQKIWGKRRAQLDWEVSVVMGFIAEIEREALPGEFSLVDQEMAVLEPDFGDELIEDLD